VISRIFSPFLFRLRLFFKIRDYLDSQTPRHVTNRQTDIKTADKTLHCHRSFPGFITSHFMSLLVNLFDISSHSVATYLLKHYYTDTLYTGYFKSEDPMTLEIHSLKF
jgi:hypothetical protein